jgi:hypothetical protein
MQIYVSAPLALTERCHMQQLRRLSNDELRASQGKFRAVVIVDSEHHQIGEDVDDRSIALALCADAGGDMNPVQIFDDQGREQLDNGRLIPAA